MLDAILSPQRVFVDLAPAPKAELLRGVCRRLAALGEVEDAEALAELLIRREALITTAVKTGFAFPHAFTPQVESLKLTIGVIREGTDYESLDGAPVEFVLLLIGPPARQDVHLRVLARLSNIAREPGALEALRALATPQAIVDFFAQSDRMFATIG